MTDEGVPGKPERLFRICYLLFRNPCGLTSAQLARLCGVDQRTIQRDIHDLGELGTLLRQSRGRRPRYAIQAGFYVPPIRLTLPEAVELYLAGRLWAHYRGRSDAHLPSALRKLASLLPERISRQMQATIEALAVCDANPQAERVMDVLSTAWVAQREVQLRYRPEPQGQPRSCQLQPYYFETAGDDAAVHVIGRTQPGDALQTLNVECIVEAAVTDRTFDLPADFNAAQLLDSCWGIRFDQVREQVRLRFTACVACRVKEACWHPSQRLRDLPDGGCELILSLAHPEEMLHWIRGWGAQVEVLAPDRLRQQMAQEAQSLAAIYQGPGGDASQTNM